MEADHTVTSLFIALWFLCFCFYHGTIYFTRKSLLCATRICFILPNLSGFTIGKNAKYWFQKYLEENHTTHSDFRTQECLFHANFSILFLLLEYFLKATVQSKCRYLLKDSFLSRRKLKLIIQQQSQSAHGGSMADSTELLFSFCDAPQMTQAGLFCVGVLLFMPDPKIFSSNLWSVVPPERRREALEGVCQQ